MNDLPDVLSDAFVLIYADDVKIFFPVKKQEDCMKLQQDLVAFSQFLARCKLRVNLSKCAVISFTKITSPILFAYTLDSKIIPRVTSVRDLGVKLDSGLTFKEHINTIVAEGLALFAVIRRFAADLEDPYTIKTLFIALVRSKFDFASVVWRPLYRTHINRLEGVQKRFVKFAVRNLGWNDRLPEYDQLCSLLDLDLLENRHRINDMVFFMKVERGQLDADYLRTRLTPNHGRQGLRRRRIYSLDTRRRNYTCNEPAYRYMRDMNTFGTVVDLNLSVDCLKTKYSLYLRRQLYVL